MVDQVLPDQMKLAVLNSSWLNINPLNNYILSGNTLNRSKVPAITENLKTITSTSGFLKSLQKFHFLPLLYKII